jgi:hypothetical protein
MKRFHQSQTWRPFTSRLRSPTHELSRITSAGPSRHLQSTVLFRDLSIPLSLLNSNIPCRLSAFCTLVGPNWVLIQFYHFGKIKGDLWDRLALCVSVCVCFTRWPCCLPVCISTLIAFRRGMALYCCVCVFVALNLYAYETHEIYCCVCVCVCSS